MRIRIRVNLFLLVFLGFLIRVAVIILSIPAPNYDTQSYNLIGSLTIRGINVYPAPADLHFPYFPLFLYVEALGALFQPYSIVFIKIIIALFDSAIIYLIHLLSSHSTHSTYEVHRRPSWQSILYAMNPISILIVGFHGQFDAIPLFFLLLAVYLVTRKNHTRLLLAGLSLSTAIVLKPWPALFLFPFLFILFQKKLNKSIFQFISFLLFLLFVPALCITIYSAFFSSSPSFIINTVLSYRPLFGFWGISLIIKELFDKWDLYTVHRFTRYFFITYLPLSLFISRKKKLIEGIFSLMLLFFVITPGFGIQYLMWIVPFLILTKPKYGEVLYFLMFLFVAINYLQWGNIVSEKAVIYTGAIAWIGMGYLLAQNVNVKSQMSKLQLKFKKI